MKKQMRTLLLLHVLLFVYSCCGLFSKTAAGEEFLSLKFCLCYAGVIGILGIYAIGWQQIIKRIPLTTAFANKAITVVWGIILGKYYFGEKITTNNVIGAVFIIVGVVLYSLSDRHSKELEDGNNE